MTQQPLVSVVIPVYNVEAYLSECLESVCGQSYQNLQIILVDDGATDASGTICDQYAARDHRVRVIHQRNQGAAVAKNAGLDAAEGEFVWMIDADDYVRTDAVERLLENQERTGADVVVFGFFNALTNGLRTEELAQPGVLSADDYLARFPKDWSCSLLWNKLFRRTCIADIRFESRRRCIDDEFFTYKVFFRAKKVQLLEERLYIYRYRKGSVTRNCCYDRQKSQDAIDGMQQRYRDILSTHPQLERGFLEHQFQMLIYMTQTYCMDAELLRQIKKQLRQKFIRAAQQGLNRGELLQALRVLCTPTKLLLRKNTYGQTQRDADVVHYYD